MLRGQLSLAHDRLQGQGLLSSWFLPLCDGMQDSCSLTASKHVLVSCAADCKATHQTLQQVAGANLNSRQTQTSAQSYGDLSSTLLCHVQILDASNFTKGPLARLWLTHHVPHGLHGCYSERYFGP